MIRVTLLTLFSLFFVLNIHAQRDCGSMDLLQQHLLDDPKLGTKMERIEQATRAFLKKNNAQRINGTVTIPVVVHVVYNSSAENISTAQINSQIQILNEDFRRTNNDADNVWSQAADSEIEFCLATVDPQGNATSGITRTSTTQSSFGTNDQVKFASSGGKDAWPAADYLNVWVCDISGSILGYAQFPGGPANTDGVVNDYQYFGNIGTASAPFDLGRTMTHEVGHYLNLRHIWGDGPCSSDDFVTDTPASDASNGGCALGHVSCGSVDMVQNYMDYSDDACMNLFTSGQKSRMRAIFDPGGARESLLTSPACGTPPPAATCTDGIQNGSETGVDCGGPDCAPCSCTGTNVTVSITLDNYPEETSWSVTNSSGATVASGGTYASQPDGSTVSIDLCLADDCYDFRINDAYGDGICCSYGSGSYTVSGGGSTLASGGSFGSSETTNFCLGGSSGPTCTDGIQNGNETGVDCGGPDCPSCPVVPTCDDGVQNGSETGVDCGGPDCPSCPVLPTCTDGVQNGSETGVDCGGPDCDPCNTGGCTDVNIDSEDFESSLGIWNDGGSDCQYINSPSYSNGNRSVRLRDNSGSSVMTTDNLALAGFEEVTIDFSYIARSMESGEDFWLQASTNGGSSYSTLATWAQGTDFNNQVREDESVVITGTFTNSTRFRFRNDASSNSDYVYIDDINISGCTSGNKEATKAPSVTEIDLDNISKVKVFPNPTYNTLNIEYDVRISASIQVNVIDMAGRRLMTKVENASTGLNTSKMEVGELNAGIYYVHINNGEEQIIKKFVVIK